uniref:Uncharacterized protein n=1 Tax=Anguilla anguilla TaxID=7936 RepID=A0A0E9XTA8_ANGAN
METGIQKLKREELDLGRKTCIRLLFNLRHIVWKGIKTMLPPCGNPTMLVY